jgi:hypothetical protein
MDCFTSPRRSTLYENVLSIHRAVVVQNWAVLNGSDGSVELAL